MFYDHQEPSRKSLLAGINSSQNTKFLLQLNPPWRNWLARSAVNRKVAGSIPAGGVPF